MRIAVLRSDPFISIDFNIVIGMLAGIVSIRQDTPWGIERRGSVREISYSVEKGLAAAPTFAGGA
jgi:hypothetical protein